MLAFWANVSPDDWPLPSSATKVILINFKQLAYTTVGP